MKPLRNITNREAGFRGTNREAGIAVADTQQGRTEVSVFEVKGKSVSPVPTFPSTRLLQNLVAIDGWPQKKPSPPK